MSQLEDASAGYLLGKLTFPIVLATVLFVLSLIGLTGAAWGYGLLLIATLLLVAGCVFFCVFILTRAFDGQWLRRSFATAFWLGAWCYILSVSVLSGYFLREALEGRIGLKWILFGPAALIAIAILDWGIYNILVGKNLATWQRYAHLISRDGLDQAALRRTLIDEVILHKTLFTLSPFRWLRHQLIFWGFGLMFAIEIVAIFVREALPAFGFRDLWHEPAHPLRLLFDFAFDITGAMMLLGCILALIYRMKVNGHADQKYTDTPTAIFLLVVVVTGFIVEGLRLTTSVGEPFVAASPVGLLFAMALKPLAGIGVGLADTIWSFHVLLSCAFIAYVPLKRLIHSCATPMGRMMNSQKSMLATKKDHSLRGLLGERRSK